MPYIGIFVFWKQLCFFFSYQKFLWLVGTMSLLWIISWFHVISDHISLPFTPSSSIFCVHSFSENLRTNYYIIAVVLFLLNKCNYPVILFKCEFAYWIYFSFSVVIVKFVGLVNVAVGSGNVEPDGKSYTCVVVVALVWLTKWLWWSHWNYLAN